MRRVLLAIAITSLCATPAAAQGSGFVGGLAGVTFQTASNAAVAGRAGMAVGGGLFVFGEGGRMMDVTPKEITDGIDDVIALGEEIFGQEITLEVRVPATYAFGGLRWVQPGEGRFRPFVEGGVGIAHLSADADATIGGLPVPDELVEENTQFDLTSNELLIAFGGGVNIVLNDRLSVDAGYRFTRIFTEEPKVNTSLIYGALVLSFGR